MLLILGRRRLNLRYRLRRINQETGGEDDAKSANMAIKSLHRNSLRRANSLLTARRLSLVTARNVPLPNIHEVPFYRRSRGHDGADEVGASALALATFEVAI